MTNDKGLTSNNKLCSLSLFLSHERCFRWCLQLPGVPRSALATEHRPQYPHTQCSSQMDMTMVCKLQLSDIVERKVDSVPLKTLTLHFIL